MGTLTKTRKEVHGEDDHGYARADNGDSGEGPVTVLRSGCREVPNLLHWTELMVSSKGKKLCYSSSGSCTLDSVKPRHSCSYSATWQKSASQVHAA